jgi:hypothetical protein
MLFVLPKDVTRAVFESLLYFVHLSQEDTKTTDYIHEFVDYRCDNRGFWLSTRNCQVPTPTSLNIEIEQQIRIFGAD